MAITTMTTAQIRDQAITNAKIVAAAGIPYSKLSFSADIVDADINAAAAISLSKLAEAVIQADGGQAFTAAQSMGGFKLTSVGTPTAAGDATTKAYVDNLSAGLSWKDSVRAASTANGALATAFENLDVMDGVTLATGDRILLKDQTAPAENGIYTVNATGAPTRATDMDVWDEVPSVAVFVSEGTANGDKGYNCTSDAGGILGTTAITWVQFAGGGATTASAVSYDDTGDLVIVAADVQDALGDLDTAIGNRTYTNDNDVTDAQSITASLDALDTAHGNRTYVTGLKVTSAETFTASVQALDDAFEALESVGVGTEGVLNIGDRAARYTNFTGGATLGLTLTGIDSALAALDAAETPAVESRTGSTSATWVLSATPSTTKGNLGVYLNGQRLTEGAGNDWTIATATITFATTLVAADVVLADYYS